MENTSFYTYLHCRPDGSPFYVGKGKGERSGQFAVRGAHHKSIVAKYGRENIGIYVFPCESEEQAFQDEIQQIAQLRLEGYELCNYTDGGEGSSGCVPSKETRAKLSAVQKGRKFSAEHCANISAAAKGRKKRPRSAEHCAKISAAQRGKPKSAEHCAKMSAAMFDKKPSAETRAKKSVAMTGKKHSPETCAKMSAAMLGKKHSLETRAKLSAAGTGKKRSPFSPEHRANMSAAAKARWARSNE